MEMSTVEKSQDTAWKDVLDTKGLSAAAPILEEYGLSCENDMSLVDEEDLVVLCSKLKPFQSKLLRKWVQGIGVEQRAAAFMKDASAPFRGQGRRGRGRGGERGRGRGCGRGQGFR